MADLPEYQRSTQIEVGETATGFARATKGLSDSYNIWSDLGIEVAQNAASQRSRELGREAGNVPGRTLIPAFTKSDAEFNKAYHEQEYNIALQNGTNVINKAAFEAFKNPSAQSVAAYEKFVTQYMQENMPTLTRETAYALKPALEQSFLASKYKLEEEVFKRALTFQKETFQQSINSGIKNATDLIANGDEAGGDEAVSKVKGSLNSDFGRTNYSEGARKEILTEVDKQVIGAKSRAQMNQAIESGSAEQVLKDAANLPPTADNLVRMQSLYGAYSQYSSMVNANDSIVTNNYTKKLVEGSLTPTDMITAKEDLSASGYSKFEVTVAKWLAQNTKDNSAIEYFNKNFNNSIALANMTPDEINTGFNARVKALSGGGTPNLADEAVVAREVQATVPYFNNKLKAGINSNDAQVAVQSAQLFRSLLQDNPLSVDGIDSKTAMKAQIINDQLAANATPLEAWEHATKNVDNLKPEDIKRREEMFEEELKTNGKKSTSDQLAWAQTQAGFNGYQVPPSIASDFLNAMKRNYVASGDWAASEKLATQVIQSLYGFTNVNGQKMVTYLPIEKTWPNGNNETYIQNVLVDKLERLFIEQKQSFDDPDSTTGFYFKFPDGIIKPQGNILSDKRIASNEIVKVKVPVPEGFNAVWLGDEGEFKQYYVPKVNFIPAIRIDAEGNEIRGRIITSSDKYTMLSQSGLPPTYGVLFLADGKNLPQQVFDTDTSAARFMFNENDMKLLDEISTRGESEAQHKAYDDRKAADELRAKIIEMREALGEDQYYD
jgi:hypothetical protein